MQRASRTSLGPSVAQQDKAAKRLAKRQARKSSKNAPPPEQDKTMPRRTIIDNPYPDTWRRGTLHKGNLEKVNSRLHYRREDSTDVHKIEVRWYLCGAVFVAFVQVYQPDYMRAGQYVVFINSQVGNGGTWFKTEDAMHQFIKDELSREPTV